jgi:hypothetical protein
MNPSMYHMQRSTVVHSSYGVPAGAANARLGIQASSCFLGGGSVHVFCVLRCVLAGVSSANTEPASTLLLLLLLLLQVPSQQQATTTVAPRSPAATAASTGATVAWAQHQQQEAWAGHPQEAWVAGPLGPWVWPHRRGTTRRATTCSGEGGSGGLHREATPSTLSSGGSPCVLHVYMQRPLAWGCAAEVWRVW